MDILIYFWKYSYATSIFAALNGIIPMEVLAFLQSINVLFTIASRLPQILSNHQNKSTGQLSGLMIFLNFGGAVARVLTTLQSVGDIVILAGYAISAFLNGVILLQIVVYGNAKPKTT